MAKELLRYDQMVEGALRGVIRESLRQIAGRGLPGNHHFYITFRTNHRGVRIPIYLREQYQDEMTVVLQYQFYGLEVTEEEFQVTLSFGGVHERLVIPFAAITTFSDPAVKFALQFQPHLEDEAPRTQAKATEGVPQDRATQQSSETTEPPKRGEVVALDAFRKKH